MGALLGGAFSRLSFATGAAEIAGLVHVGLTLAGALVFAPCIGLISKLVLNRQDLV